MAFMINSDSDTPQPQDMRHPTPQVVGYTLSGRPVVQGYHGLEITYQILDYARMQTLQSFYNPTNPAVTVTFDDPVTGESTTMNAMMGPIEIGARQTLYFMNVNVKFTRLTPTS